MKYKNVEPDPRSIQIQIPESLTPDPQILTPDPDPRSNFM